MASRNPSGTFTRAGPPRGTPVVPVQKLSERALFCGCCCVMSHRGLLFLLALFYLAIATLSFLSVCAGINDHMTHYRGQVQVDTNKYKITSVQATSLNLGTGWLRYSDSKSSGYVELVNLSTGSSILGFIVAFLLLCSGIVASWKFFTMLCCSSRRLRKTIICSAVLLSLLTIGFLFAFYAITSRDLDSYAHQSLGVPALYDVAMVPDYAWYSGFAGGLLWIVVVIFTVGLPSEDALEYHKY